MSGKQSDVATATDESKTPQHLFSYLSMYYLRLITKVILHVLEAQEMSLYHSGTVYVQRGPGAGWCAC